MKTIILGALQYISGSISGTLQLDNSNVTALNILGGFTLNGSSARVVDQFGNDALSNLGAITGSYEAAFNLSNGASLTTNVGFGVNWAQILNVSSGSSLNIGGGLGNEGGVYVTNSSLTVNGDANIGNGNVGSLLSVTGGQLNVAGNVSVNGPVSKFLVTGGSDATIQGNFANNGPGVFSNAISTQVSSGSSLIVLGNITNSDGAAINVTNGSVLTVGGALNNASCSSPVNCFGYAPSVALTGGSVANVSGVTTNAGGNILVDGTSVLNATGGLTQTAGTTVVDGVLNARNSGVNIQGGTLSGTGIVNGNVTIAGTMMPGDAPGTFTINGDYTQTSTGTLMEQVGWLPGSTSSLLQVNGVADLDGTLALSLLNGYDPIAGDSFVLMTFWSEDGTFNTITGLNLGNNLFLDVIYDPHDIRVDVESLPVSTPEPSSILLLLIGLMAIVAFTRKRLIAINAN